LSDTKVYEPQIRALLGTASHFCEVVVLTLIAKQVEPNNGELWSKLAFTYLLTDDLQNAYTAYQHALFHLPNPKDTQVSTVT